MVKPCPQLNSQGACSDNSCPYSHDIHFCEDCGNFYETLSTYQAHIGSKRHERRVSGASTFFHCPVCDVNIQGQKHWATHVSSSGHRKKTSRKGLSPTVDPEEAASTSKSEYCNLCAQFVPRTLWTQHALRPGHQKKEKFAAFKATLEEAEKNKHGVTVSDSFDFGIVSPPDAQTGVTMQLRVETTVPASRIRIIQTKLSSTTASNISSAFSVVIAATIVTHGRPVTGQVEFRQSHNGRYEDRVEIIFEDEKLSQRFVIVRSLRAIIGSQADHDLLRPTAPFAPRKRTTREPETEVVPGVLPPALNAIQYVVKLSTAAIPKNLSETLSTGSTSDVIGRVRRIFLPKKWDCNTYGRYFKNLIWIEEYRMEHDLEIYDISGAKLQRHGNYYHLDVPGLAENRPSVLVGDRILVQPHNAPSGRWYEGGVHFVRKESVGLRFHVSFKGWSAGQLYKVRFKLNRYPLRRQHQALDTVFTQDRILLPLQIHVKAFNGINFHPRLFNKLIATNAHQLLAVSAIVRQPPGTAPFVIFGPPGTGKTVTVVEAIRQLLVRNPAACILACAPSNSAADLIASRLTALGTEVLFRFYAPSRDKKQIPDELLPFTITNADGNFTVPPISVLRRFRVIVCTCVSASMPYGIGMARGHFSHIFFDEAGQATEPETMIAIKTMADNSTLVILSGDPKQLGPIIRSNVARELGLETSYLERLMSYNLYDEQVGHGTTVIKLVKNFRSHNAILKFPNERFYKGELEQCGDPKTIDSFIGSPQLASKTFPIVFHALFGKDDQEASSPSFFNIDEATQVRTYIEALRADRRHRLTDQDIGVITPYHAQCLKVRAALRGKADGVKVGSVEEFQGQERKVIIISTVRSSRDFVQYDLKHTLGFVANPRRFNVAVTRAQAMLIIIGNPTVLSLDPLWRSFLNYVHLKGGWKGPSPNWDTREQVTEDGGYDQSLRKAALVDMNDFTRRMESLTLAGINGVEDGDDADANVDRPWREVE